MEGLAYLLGLDHKNRRLYEARIKRFTYDIINNDLQLGE